MNTITEKVNSPNESKALPAKYLKNDVTPGICILQSSHNTVHRVQSTDLMLVIPAVGIPSYD